MGWDIPELHKELLHHKTILNPIYFSVGSKFSIENAKITNCNKINAFVFEATRYILI